MRPTRFVLALAAAGAASCGLLLAGLPTAASAVGDIPWRTDLDAARAEARAAGRPLMVVFR